MTTSRLPTAVPVDHVIQPAADGPPGRDGLEHWLQDLRTDLSNDPPGWLDPTAVPAVAPLDEDALAWDDAEPDGERRDGRHHVDEVNPTPTYGDAHPPAPSGGGRHRAVD